MSIRSCGLLLICGLTIAALGPSTAQAACGDWLSHPATNAENLAAEPDDSNPQHVPAQLPCSGPGCRRAPMTPAPLAPTSVPDRELQDRLACGYPVDVAIPGWSGDLCAEIAVKPCDGHCFEIEHPPR